MTFMRIPSEEEIRLASQQGEEAVIALWRETFLDLAERIQKLEDQMAENSRNSAKPPSSAGYDRKRLFIILGAIGVIILLAWFTIFPLIKNLRISNNSNDQLITKVTLCDVDASELCIVAFGTDNNERMVINFQLPNANYPAFYVNAANKGIVNMYLCNASKAVPTSVNCAGARTPLGETIDIEVYAANSNLLIARGTIMVSAMVLSTSESNLLTPTSTLESSILTPTLLPSPTAAIQTAPTPTVVFTPTPGTAYPNP